MCIQKDFYYILIIYIVCFMVMLLSISVDGPYLGDLGYSFDIVCQNLLFICIALFQELNRA